MIIENFNIIIREKGDFELNDEELDKLLDVLDIGDAFEDIVMNAISVLPEDLKKKIYVIVK